MRRRKAEEAFFKALMGLSLVAIVASLTAILGVIVVRGAPALSWEMIVKTPQGGYYMGKGGGIANAIIGSALLGGGATIVSLLLALPIALALQREYTSPRLAYVTRLALDLLWGTPSIVYGAFGFVIMVFFGIGVSLLGGIIALTFLMLPIMARAMDEIIRMVPIELKETAFSLGATRLETTFGVVFRQALPGIITGIMLAFGRGIGDAASILFTAGYTDYIPRSIFDPVASLPLAVFFQIGTPFPEVQARAYAAALILLVIVLAVNLVARLLNKRYSKNIIR